MNNQEFLNSQNGAQKESPGLDYKRILYRAGRYWYIVILSLFISLAIAYLINRYSPRIYPVSASIIIKENEENSGAGQLLYENSLINPFTNYLNELYIIRSYPLIKSVIEELDFEVSFYQKGNVLTSEIYGYRPFTVTILNKADINNVAATFIILNRNQYQLGPVTDDNEDFIKRANIFNFGDTITYQGIRGIFYLTDPSGIDFKNENKYLFTYTNAQQLAGAYVGGLGASWAEKGSGVVNLSMTGTNPKKAGDFLNGLIKRYQADDLEEKNLTASRTIDFITKQLTEITDSLRQVENLLERFKDKNVVTDLNQEASRLYEKLETVELQKTEAIIRNSYHQYLINYIQNDQNLDQVILPGSLGISDGILGELIKDMIDIQLEIKGITGNLRLDNPLVNERRVRLQNIKNSIIESVKNQQNTDKIKTDFVSKQISTLEKQLNYLPAAERQFISISRNYSLLENLYIFLLQKRAEAGISKASTTTDIAVVNEPMVGGPISPKPTQNYMIAGIIGLALPLLIFGLMEYLNTRIQSKEDLEKLTAIPFIGGLGHKKSLDNKAVLTSPKSQISESFRALRSNLSYFLKDKNNAVILVSSSVSGEGKTFTTINLASVLAFSGKRILIVGADMRKPKLFNDFNLDNSLGLSSYLAGMNSFSDIVRKTGIDNLDLISGGPVPPNPSELILQAQMDVFFAEAKKRYDYIIIDSPPIAIVADAFVLMNHCDHLLFVTRQNYTPKNMVSSVDEFYKSGRIKNISIVLNDIYKSGPGYGYGYNYGYGYGYTYGSRKNGDGYYDEQTNNQSKTWWNRFSGNKT